LIHADDCNVHAAAKVIEQRATAAADIHYAVHGFGVGAKKALYGGKGPEAFVNENQVAMEDFEDGALDIGRVH
jgi:hypothetical protein